MPSKKSRAKSRTKAKRARTLTDIVRELQGEVPEDYTGLVEIMQRGLRANAFQDLNQVKQFAEQLQQEEQEEQEGLAEAIEAVEEWTCTVEQAMRALTIMGRAGMPTPIVEAFRKSACVPRPRTWHMLSCSHAECDTCAKSCNSESLIGCETKNCSYKQCVDCIVKGGAGVCLHAECNNVHWHCPACRQQADGGQLQLSDPRITKEHVIRLLNRSRKQAREHILETMDVLDDGLSEFRRSVRNYVL
jgi:hypothetical protein